MTAMQNLYDVSAPKKATNLSINSDLLLKSRALNVNLSATLEEALTEQLAKSKAEKWKKQNKAAIKVYNDFVDENGCFGDEYKEF
jgi:antitoxin CcdA